MMKLLSSFLATSAIVAFFGCSETAAPSADSKSNWYISCQVDDDCDPDLSCLCGVCTATCSDAGACSSERASSCSPLALSGLCPDSTFAESAVCVAECDETTDCSEGQECVQGECVSELSACAEAWDWDDELADFEEEILAAILEAVTDGYDCGDGEITRTTFTANSQLKCAARLHAQTMDEGDFVGPISESGTWYRDNVTGAGWMDGVTGGIFGNGSDPQGPLEADCATLFDRDFAQIGVGAFGDSWVVVVGQEAISD